MSRCSLTSKVLDSVMDRVHKCISNAKNFEPACDFTNLWNAIYSKKELERLQNGGRPLQANSSGNRSGTDERRFADIIKEKPLKVTIRVLVPVKEHPKVSAKGLTPALYEAYLLLVLRLRVHLRKSTSHCGGLQK
ncbi:hypothetical protein B7P43_G15607 [Cryptotermes secundus]|uniref:Uncharacterized protein n=1 Tax=Cryptotermes secundus TaxID=105785 RepID=A0A2J7QAU8_9NEOP|nr:hypothetical protein B7P43_G15607 [Cryptotermes secundus]